MSDFVYLEVDHMVILFFNFLRNCHTLVHSNCTILRFHQQCPRVSVSPYPHQPLVFSVLFFILFWQWPSLRCEMVFHYSFDLHSLMIGDVEHLSICLLAIYVSSLETCLLKAFAHLLIELFGGFRCWVEEYGFFLHFVKSRMPHLFLSAH